MLTAIKPAYRDLWFRKKMLEDEETMSFNHTWGGTIPFPEERWYDWYDYWILNAGDTRYYRYLQNEGSFVGEIAFHYDIDLDGYVANIIIFSKFRGRGYGGEALELLCAEARRKGINVIYDNIAADNPAICLFIKHGFQEEKRLRNTILLKKTL